MVRSRWLTPESILTAMKKGDFYASTGIELETLEFDQSTRTITIEIKAQGDAQYTTQFIGTPKRFDETTTPRDVPPSNTESPVTLDYSADVGKVLSTVTGLKATYTLTGDELYVRATITSDKPPMNPTKESPYQKAWTQPVGW